MGVAGPAGGEIFLPFRHPVSQIPAITEIRSTVMVSSLQAVRARGLYDTYLGYLSPSTRAEIESLVAGRWLPIALGMEHYAAMGRLGFDAAVIEQIGAEVADRLNRSALSIAVTLSREAGMSPWTALSHSHRITEISWKGSDVLVAKLGPKEARYDWVGQPCASIPYFASAFGGFLRALIGLFCVKAVVRVIPGRTSGSTASYRLSWV